MGVQKAGQTAIQRKEEQTITPTDKLNIVCFVIFMVISIICLAIAKKNETPMLEVSDRMDSIYGSNRGVSFNITLKRLTIGG